MEVLHEKHCLIEMLLGQKQELSIEKLKQTQIEELKKQYDLEQSMNQNYNQEKITINRWKKETIQNQNENENKISILEELIKAKNYQLHNFDSLEKIDPEEDWYFEENQKAKKFLNSICNKKVEYLEFQIDVHNILHSCFDDFNPQYNKSYPNFKKSHIEVQINIYIIIQQVALDLGQSQTSMALIKIGQKRMAGLMNGEFYIMASSIVKNNLKPCNFQRFRDDLCQDEYGRTVKVGEGVYFADSVQKCIQDLLLTQKMLVKNILLLLW
ncbi:unnamed protein product [Paramecium octaurelia]|uniref:Uncharacterized protein n=1 Tax=Paramecium octaurelia TaxID=43137 RepID=A0A8S1XF98_PAROT|nr:unnamed protein product [Paramecium octaurelia]CAD8199533.1 unnamed protein product [Paramecium octaurelia]